MIETPPDPPPRPPRRRWLRRLVSVWLVFHLTAVVVAPASVNSSALVRNVWWGCRPYLQALYLNHGYRFFAPEPGESTLVAYVVEREEGAPVSGRFPNRGITPRLLYHRHFMLSEHLNFPPPDVQQQWCASFARHLGREHDGTQVGLTRVIHRLPTMEMVRSGVTLDHPGSYVEQPLGVFPCE